ncbi:MAG: TM2 domain-containing protein [Bacteroidaceae bacterium]|nr:TM2 domain-containing protein [Bacteroidaceae bacterium]
MENATKKCPFCGEIISADASKCRFCGEWLNMRPANVHPQYNMRPTNVHPQYNVTPQYSNGKSKGVAALLAIIFAGLGINYFYLGKVAIGCIFVIVWLLFCWTLFVPIVLSIINIVQGIIYLSMSDREFAYKYNN